MYVCMYCTSVCTYVRTYAHVLIDGPMNIYTVTITPPIYHPPYRLTLSLGTYQDYPGSSCKHILEFLNATCNKTQIDGPYWITLRDECPRKEQTIQTIQVNMCFFYHKQMLTKGGEVRYGDGKIQFFLII